jgi:hypothetical protein
MEVKIGDKQLTPGVDFIVNEASGKGNGTTDFQTLGIYELYTGKYSFSKLDKNKMFYFLNLGYGGDTLTKVNENLVKIAKYAPVMEVVNTKFTWSVSGTAYKFPFIQVQESVFKNHFQSNTTAVSYDIDAQIKNHTARNVIGYLPATKKSKKTIMITAHYDHLGIMGVATYFPGANDNASGNGMLISLAEKFKTKRPNHTENRQRWLRFAQSSSPCRSAEQSREGLFPQALWNHGKWSCPWRFSWVSCLF